MTPEHSASPEGERPTIRVVPPEPTDDETLKAISSSLSSLSSTLTAVSGQLSQLNDAFDRTKAVRTTEEEIGRLFVRAQDYVDRSIEEAQDWARRVVEQANDQADRILHDAQAQAQRIVEEARSATILQPEAVARLSSTIEAFSRTNTELFEELASLRTALVLRQSAPPPDPAMVVLPSAGAAPVAASPTYPPPASAPGTAQNPAGDHRLAG